MFFNQNNDLEIILEFLSEKSIKQIAISNEITSDISSYKKKFEEIFKATLRIRHSVSEKNNNIYFTSSNKGTRKSSKDIDFFNTQFIWAKEKTTGSGLALDYEIFINENNRQSNHILEGFRVIDDSIEGIELSRIENSIKLKRKDEKAMSLSMYGDAMNKIADYILRIVRNTGGVILIDEIENGIHYKNQEAVWETLFKLSEKFDVQIFATTHSAEMINAFKNTLLKDGKYNGVYFEMIKHYATGDIILVKSLPIL